MSKQDVLNFIAGVVVGFILFMITIETEKTKLRVQYNRIYKLTVEMEEQLIELREKQNSNKVFDKEKKRNRNMSEYSGCDDFTALREAYKKSDKLDKFLKTPKMKKLRKQAMKLQGAEKLIKKVKDQGEA